MKKKENFLPPFVPTDLRAWMEGSVEERALVGSIRLFQWLEGTEAPVYLETIQRLLGTPGDPMSPRQAARVISKVRARGWLMTKRQASQTGKGKGAPVYFLAVPLMDFKEARKRLELQPATDGRLDDSNLPLLDFQPAKNGRSTIQEKDLQERPKSAPTASEAPKAKKPEPYLDALRETWKARGLILTDVGGYLRGQIQRKGEAAGMQLFNLVLKAYLDLPNERGHSVGGFVYSFDGLANRYRGRHLAERAETLRKLKRNLGEETPCF